MTSILTVRRPINFLGNKNGRRGSISVFNVTKCFDCAITIGKTPHPKSADRYRCHVCLTFFLLSIMANVDDEMGGSAILPNCEGDQNNQGEDGGDEEITPGGVFSFLSLI